jgi:hypothetical protein
MLGQLPIRSYYFWLPQPPYTRRQQLRNDFSPIRQPTRTICKLNGIYPVQRDGFVHLFFECHLTNELHNKVFECFLSEIYFENEQERKKLWLCGFNNLGSAKSKLFL